MRYHWVRCACCSEEKRHTAFIVWIRPSKTCARLPDPEEEGIMLLSNISNYTPKDMASQPRRPLSFSSTDELLEPHISQEDRMLYTL